MLLRLLLLARQRLLAGRRLLQLTLRRGLLPLPAGWRSLLLMWLLLPLPSGRWPLLSLSGSRPLLLLLRLGHTSLLLLLLLLV